MTLVSALADCWLGLCRKAPKFHAPRAASDQPGVVHEGWPDGGNGGPGTIRRGIEVLRSGARTLLQNRHLFWFTCLTGLVLVGHILAQGVLLYASPNGGYILITSPVILFILEFPTVFCLMFLLAGLALSISPDKEGSDTFLHALTRAKTYVIPLLLWSALLAAAGTVFFSTGLNMSVLNPVCFHPFNLFGALTGYLNIVLGQFPFSWSLNPEAWLPGGGVFSGLDVTFKRAVLYTLLLSAVNGLLFILTLFVVPQLVLERRHLRAAITGSFGMMMKIRGELAAFLLGLAVIVVAALLTFFLFQFTGIDQIRSEAGYTSISSVNPGMAWIGFGLLYILALTGFVFGMITIGGIATLDLYRYARSRETRE